MALLDKVFKQRMVGALVLVALAVIFLPMLFSRQDEQRQIQVAAPSAPQMPVMPQVQVEPVAVPEPQVIAQEPAVVEQPVVQQQAPAPVAPVVAKPVVVAPKPRSSLRRSRSRRHRPSWIPRKSVLIPTVCLSAGRCNWSACPIGQALITCKKRFAIKDITHTCDPLAE